MKLDILNHLSADISDFEAQVRADLKARLAANPNAQKAPEAIGLEPYVVSPGTEAVNLLANLLGELAEPGTVFMAHAHLTPAQAMGPIGPYTNQRGQAIPMVPACVSTALLGSGDQTVVFPTPDAVHWLPRASVHRIKLIKMAVPGKPSDALLVQEFGLPLQGKDSSPWIFDHLNLPEDVVPRLQRVLMALKPVHQAVAIAAICHPGISNAHAAGLSAHALDVGVTSAMRLETMGLERDEASLARLACLISELGSLSKTDQNQPDPIAQAPGIVVDQVETRGADSVDSPGSADTFGAGMSGETRAHPLTVYLLADLLERFAQIDPQDGGWLRDLLTSAVHQHFRMGSRSGPFSAKPVNPTFAAMAEPLVCALRYARQSLRTTESAQRPLFEADVTSVGTDKKAANDPTCDKAQDTSAPKVDPADEVVDAGDLDQLDHADTNGGVEAESDSDLLDLAALLSDSSDPPAPGAPGDSADQGDHSDQDASAELRLFDVDRRAYIERSVAGPRPNLDWAAGMLDGDGCIAIVKQTYPDRNPIYRLVVQICQNCLQTLQHFRHCVGVYCPINEVKRRIEHNKQVYTLNYSGPKALLVIERLRAHLVRKSAEAEVALSFIEKGQVGRRFGPRGVPPQLEAIRISHYNKLRALK